MPLKNYDLGRLYNTASLIHCNNVFLSITNGRNDYSAGVRKEESEEGCCLGWTVRSTGRKNAEIWIAGEDDAKAGLFEKNGEFIHSLYTLGTRMYKNEVEKGGHWSQIMKGP